MATIAAIRASNGKETAQVQSITETDRFVLAARLKGYLGQHGDAVDVLTEALSRYPDDLRLLQLRGEKRLVIRDPAGALRDLTAAAEKLADHPDEHEFYRTEVVQDVLNLVLGRDDRLGRQNPVVNEDTVAATKHLVKGTLHATTWYHLGMARYLTGDFDAAATAFGSARRMSIDEHRTIAALDWEYMALRRAFDDNAAAQLLDLVDTFRYDPAALDSPAVPNSLKDCYLQRLRMYRGELGPQDLLRNDNRDSLAIATMGYGVGNWYLYNGKPAAAARAFQRVLEMGDWATFGYAAAEVDSRLIELTTIRRA